MPLHVCTSLKYRCRCMPPFCSHGVATIVGFDCLRGLGRRRHLSVHHSTGFRQVKVARLGLRRKVALGSEKDLECRDAAVALI
eukprot:8926043-Pyramimonas_sp.AAC.1